MKAINILIMLALAIPFASAQEPLLIQKQGSMTVSGTVVQRIGEYDNGKFGGWGTPLEQGQSYHGDHAVVDFQIPIKPHRLPLVFVHGYGQSSRSWSSTPDGREGFNNLMLRHQYSTYLVDLPGRGRAGRTTEEVNIKPQADEQFWFDIFRLGEWPTFHKGVQFPIDSISLEQFFRQMTPNLSTSNKDVPALNTLFDEIGEGVLVTHSAGGIVGWMVSLQNSNVKAIASYEPGGYLFPEGEIPEPMPSLTGTLSGVAIPMDEFIKLTKIPIVLYFGDYIPEEVTDKLGSENWRVRLQMGRKFVETINKYGGDATLIELPQLGIYGNTHFLMSDLNNTQIADLLNNWLHTKGLTHPYGEDQKTISQEQEIMNLSRIKWQWMSERKVNSLDSLFHANSVFVHMGGTMNKEQELGVINGGMIQYKKAEIFEESVRIVGETAILLGKIRLLALVGGNEVINPFMVTEVYVKENGIWKLVSLSFTRLLEQNNDNG